MKLLVAIIQPEKLDEVREALVRADITRITVSRTTGHGRGRADADLYRGQAIVPNLRSGVRIEIACNDPFVEPAIEAIRGAAQDDDSALGDGKIFVLPLEDCIRIRTGERGADAI